MELEEFLLLRFSLVHFLYLLTELKVALPSRNYFFCDYRRRRKKPGSKSTFAMHLYGIINSGTSFRNCLLTRRARGLTGEGPFFFGGQNLLDFGCFPDLISPLAPPPRALISRLSYLFVSLPLDKTFIAAAESHILC